MRTGRSTYSEKKIINLQALLLLLNYSEMVSSFNIHLSMSKRVQKCRIIFHFSSPSDMLLYMLNARISPIHLMPVAVSQTICHMCVTLCRLYYEYIFSCICFCSIYINLNEQFAVFKPCVLRGCIYAVKYVQLLWVVFVLSFISIYYCLFLCAFTSCVIL